MFIKGFFLRFYRFLQGMEFYEKNEPRPSHYRYYNEKRNTLQEEEDNEMAAGKLIKVLVDVLVPLFYVYLLCGGPL